MVICERDSNGIAVTWQEPIRERAVVGVSKHIFVFNSPKKYPVKKFGSIRDFNMPIVDMPPSDCIGRLDDILISAYAHIASSPSRIVWIFHEITNFAVAEYLLKFFVGPQSP